MSNIGMNKVIFLENAGQNAEMESAPDGKSVANFSLAMNQLFRDKKDGNQRVEFVRCLARDKLAQIAEKLVAKGTGCLSKGGCRLAIRGSGRCHENVDRGCSGVAAGSGLGEDVQQRQ